MLTHRRNFYRRGKLVLRHVTALRVRMYTYSSIMSISFSLRFENLRALTEGYSLAILVGEVRVAVLSCLNESATGSVIASRRGTVASFTTGHTGVTRYIWLRTGTQARLLRNRTAGLRPQSRPPPIARLARRRHQQTLRMNLTRSFRPNLYGP